MAGKPEVLLVTTAVAVFRKTKLVEFAGNETVVAGTNVLLPPTSRTPASTKIERPGGPMDGAKKFSIWYKS